MKHASDLEHLGVRSCKELRWHDEPHRAAQARTTLCRSVARRRTGCMVETPPIHPRSEHAQRWLINGWQWRFFSGMGRLGATATLICAH
jgi:hypothetical protein